MKKTTFLLVFFLLGIALMAQSTYKVDPAHTSINFKVKHLGITFVQGKFEKFDGAITGEPDKVEQARIYFNVETNSINTSVEARDNHLKSADFFDVEKFPAMTFESTGIEKVDDQNYKLNGILAIKDVSKPVTFDVKYGGTVTGQDGVQTVGFVATTTINRLDYNVAYDPDAATIGKDVVITLFLEFKKSSDK
ncbi:MAG TPA: polyisoprenoid-binding protein [Porphyromonadaceae bacterium]|jgi:polyisoprenoid-binding protein YceI|uniref:YceI family protein n=1 Tax=Limibacterium fermenti TaxID=3229863 RepID=UPI000E9AC1D1|nr:polyisoprenoid-binding protein [Porphyromonadaceae bacterium]HBL32391.1 polyisoprenoid-binding protein [Porphyromonadaceae bacterium]HBX20248.1 polyisoprenoid-binding protein [Porphyromonadaceae bacterium]HBX46527.1 polyisoprenoid-binding protein [Porphyromonadaceae bacterium]HCM19883.1 polyisoprenoid-binding protein [Porphyromonadaceae bacterium]